MIAEVEKLIAEYDAAKRSNEEIVGDIAEALIADALAPRGDAA
jgi:hypothetical protein